MTRLAMVATMFVGVGCWAQQPAATATTPPVLVSPQAAYDDASRPVDIVRKSITNWSDSELTALGVAMTKAGIACGQRKPGMYTGDDLVALARLCSFGQDWPKTKATAAAYIQEGCTEKPQLSLAYALQLDAAMHMHDLKEIMSDAKAMLAGAPYDANVNDASDSAISYMQLAYTNEAIALETIRQPLLLAALGSDKPVIPRRALYASGLEQAELLQYMNRPTEAAASVAMLDAALGTFPGGEAKLSADEMVPIGMARRQYGLLGNPLPKVTPSMSLANLSDTPEIEPQFGAGTALMLFPDWCAQCVSMRGKLWKAAQTPQGIVKLVVLLAENPPDKEALKAEAALRWQGLAGSHPTHDDKAVMNGAPGGLPEKPKTASELLLGTQTLVVPANTTEMFSAGDFPFVVMLDHAGIVRFAGSAPETALMPGDFLDRLVEHVAETWPPEKPL